MQVLEDLPAAVGAALILAVVVSVCSGAMIAGSVPANVNSLVLLPGSSGTLSGSSTTHPAPPPPSASTAWNWVEKNPSLAPSPRAGAATVYDVADGYVLLFGGCPYWGGDYWGHVCTALGDTWTLHDGVWTNLTGSIAGPSPPPRIDASIAYDRADGYVVMFGGYDGTTNTVYNDTWTFNAGHWTQMHPTVSPTARNGAGMAGDDAAHEVLLFGGDSNATGSLVFFNDTWEYHAEEWSRLSTVTAPSARYDMAMAYDPGDESALLFGGWSPAQTQSYGDTWSFSNGSWSEIHSPTNPPAENSGTMAFDPAANLMIMTGGHVGENVSSATWTYNFTSGWQSVATSSAPAPRWGLSLGYDPASSALWLFGGFIAFWNGTGNPPLESFFGDTWEFSTSGTSSPTPAVYMVTFVETGLATGVAWTATFSGVPETSTSPTITFDASNGTYEFEIASVAGYSLGIPNPDYLTVSGSAATVVVPFSAIPSSSSTPSSSASSSATFLEGALTGGAIVGTVLVALFVLRPKRLPPGGPTTLS